MVDMYRYEQSVASAGQWNGAHRTLVIERTRTKNMIEEAENEIKSLQEEIASLRGKKDRHIQRMTDLDEVLGEMKFVPPPGFDIWGEQVPIIEDID